ncbi:hypothetical protein B0H10DRAFT_1943335 [Mycena sp. CBHHK59/15]|nr:hypothetical protein B0H10DRAFT_1943335 [Mycena sp. CBHHK59/15]
MALRYICLAGFPTSLLLRCAISHITEHASSSPEVVDSLSYRAIDTSTPGSVILPPTTQNHRQCRCGHKDCLEGVEDLRKERGGVDNIFIFIVESYSPDAKPPSFSPSTRPSCNDTSIPRPPLMLTAPLRINILVATRNLAIEQLVEWGGYDRLLFSNDVFVKAEAIIELLNTRDGVGYSVSLTSHLVTHVSFATAHTGSTLLTALMAASALPVPDALLMIIQITAPTAMRPTDLAPGRTSVTPRSMIWLHDLWVLPYLRLLIDPPACGRYVPEQGGVYSLVTDEQQQQWQWQWGRWGEQGRQQR